MVLVGWLCEVFVDYVVVFDDYVVDVWIWCGCVYVVCGECECVLYVGEIGI